MHAHSNKSSDSTVMSASNSKKEDGNLISAFFDNRVNPAKQLQAIIRANPRSEQNNELAQRMSLEEAAGLEEVYNRARERGGDLDEAYAAELADSNLEVDDAEHDDDYVQGKFISTPPVQRTEFTTVNDTPVQLAHSSNTVSGPKSYGALTNVLFARDGDGNIDFSKPKQYHLGNDYAGVAPVLSASFDISAAVGTHGKENRYQHFKSANIQNGEPQLNGSSPDGKTWHHLTAPHFMHLVDRTIHRKHGHNGGVHIW